jgi:nitroreductase
MKIFQGGFPMRNPVLQAIHDRRSIRAYTKEQITDEQLNEIIAAGLAAPSARNTQPWHFTAVQNAALMERVNRAMQKEAEKTLPPDVLERIIDPAYNVFYHAPTVIFISCPPLEEMRYAQTDVGIAIQNMALAAHALGLGSVILGMPRFAFEGEEAEALRRELAFPAGYDYCLSLAIGTPAMEKEAHPILEGRVTVLKG